MTDQNGDSPRAVLITGTSTGIGAACALDLDERGYQVFAGVRKTEDGEKLKEETSDRVVPVIIDVTKEDTIEQAATEIKENVGDRGLWGLINNAGILVPGPLECVPLDDVRRQYEVNVIGTIAVTQKMVPLVRQAAGRVINIGSITGKIAMPYLGPYSSSKFALESLTDVMRLELRQWGIQVSIIEPDSVATPIWGKLQDEAFEMGKHIPRDVRKLYKEDLSAMWKVAQKMNATGMEVENVLQTIRHALTANKAKPRYAVGPRTKWLFWAIRHLPTRMFDWLIRRETGVK